MNYLNIEIKVLCGDAFIGAEPVARATWLCLLRYCAQQENGGRIAEAAEWGDRRWMQLCCVTKAEVRHKCELWKWTKNDLLVNFYPLRQETGVRAKRAAAIATTDAKTAAENTPPIRDNSIPPGNGSEKKGKEREMEGEAERLAKRLAPRLPNETPKDKPGLRLIGEVNGSTEGNEAGTGKPGLQKLAEVDRKKPTIEEIYAAYPKKSAWGEAMKEIAAAIEGGADPKMLMERVKTFAAAVALWSREYRFNREGRDVCPNASTWFKQHRWKDDTETWLPQGGGKIETRRQKMLREAEEEAKRREAQA